MQDVFPAVLPGLHARRHVWQKHFDACLPRDIATDGIRLCIRPSAPHHYWQPAFKLSEEETSFVGGEIASLLSRGLISRSRSAKWCVNPFVVRQPCGKRRVCFDMSQLTDHLEFASFKMEGLPEARSLLRPNMWMGRLDLKDAYHSIATHPTSRPYLAFHFLGQVFQWNVLPFGLAAAPLHFTQVLSLALRPLRDQGIQIVQYLDDLLIVAETPAIVCSQLLRTIHWLARLGFQIGIKKSHLEPTQRISFLGFILDTTTMELIVPREKLRKISRECYSAIRAGVLPARKLASLLGLLQSVTAAINLGTLHSRNLQRLLGPRHFLNAWNASVPLNEDARADLLWWASHARDWNGRPLPLSPPPPTVTIMTDASEVGWGIVTPHQTLSGYWPSAVAGNSSNWRELWTACRAVIWASRHHPGESLLLLTDNTTTVAALNRQGTTACEQLLLLAREALISAARASLSIRAAYLPGSENGLADAASRRAARHDYMISDLAFRQIQEVAPGRLHLDAFASATTTRLPKFWTRADNALARHFPRQGLYAFPPPRLILPTIQRAWYCRVKWMALVTPAWSSLLALPLLRQISPSPLFLPARAVVRESPSHHRVHPTSQGLWVWFPRFWNLLPP